MFAFLSHFFPPFAVLSNFSGWLVCVNPYACDMDSSYYVCRCFGLSMTEPLSPSHSFPTVAGV